MINIPTEVKKSSKKLVAVAEVEVKETTNTNIKKPKLDEKGRAYGTGRRKNSSARVWIKPGTGKMIVNGKVSTDYLKRPVLQMVINQPFEEIGSVNKFDVTATVIGGGLSGQAGAIVLGIARALVNYNPELYHTILRKSGFLTRDSREVERKKYGHAKARKSFQFSKR